MTVTRRQFLVASATTAALATMPRTLRAAPATSPSQRYKISASDWMLLKRQKLGALQLAKDCGLDAVEVDMGSLSKNPTIDNAFRDEKFLNDYVAKARELNLEISSFAMSC